MKKMILVAIAAIFAGSLQAQTPLRPVKMDSKSTETSVVKMVSTVDGKSIKEFQKQFSVHTLNHFDRQMLAADRLAQNLEQKSKKKSEKRSEK